MWSLKAGFEEKTFQILCFMGNGNRFHILSFFFFFSLWVECTRGRNRTQLFIRALTQTIISSLDTNFLLKKTLFHFSLPQVNIFSLIFIDNWLWWRLGGLHVIYSQDFHILRIEDPESWIFKKGLFLRIWGS